MIIQLRTGLASLALAAASSSAWTGDLPRLPVGMNVQGAAYWERAPYLDPLLTSGEWIAYHEGGPWDDQTAAQVPLSSDGWPLSIPRSIGGVPTKVRTMVNNCRAGDYVLSYSGKGRVNWNGGASSRLAGSQVVVTLTGDCGHAWMDIDSSSASDPIRSMHLVPLEYASAPAKAPLFDPEFVRGLKPFHALRYMDWTNTNGSTQMRWEDRPVPGDRTFGTGRGMPWEHAIALSNQLGSDAWICVPHAADDQYVRNLAALFRDSLRPELKTYVEYSNEIWNWGFEQAHWIGRNGVTVPWGTDSETMAAPAALRDSLRSVGRRVCHDPDEYCHPEKDAWMMGRLFRLWEPVWAGQRSRTVTVATGQHAWTDNSRRILSWLVDSMGIRPDAFSVAGYMGFETSRWDAEAIPRSVLPRDDDTLLDDYFHRRWLARPDTVKGRDVVAAMALIYPYTSRAWTLETVRILRSFKVPKFLVYEGGQHAQPHEQKDWDYNEAVWNAQIDPAMYDLYLRNLQLHDSVGCDLYAAFSYAGERRSKYGSWGSLETYAQSALSPEALRLAAPKYAALVDANEPRSTGLASSPRRAASRPPAQAVVVDGVLRGVAGTVEVRAASGRLLGRGDARALRDLPEGLVVVRPEP